MLAVKGKLVNPGQYMYHKISKCKIGFNQKYKLAQTRISLKCLCRIDEALKSQDDVKTTAAEEDLKFKALKSIEKSGEIEFSGERVAQWVGATVLFGGGIWWFEGFQKAEEYFAGYLLEQSLSVDNLFVFILIFNFFQTPVECQKKCLAVGIASAAILRLIMIVLGVQLVERFEPVLLLFAAILVYSSYQLLFQKNEREEPEDLSQNWAVKTICKIFEVTDQYDGDRFFTIQEGIRKATPMILALTMIELSDIIFAVDSIPAVFGVTLDPFIVFSSNMFAILSLRSLYSFISIVMSELKYLDKSVALVLGFIGVKMIADFQGFEIGTEVSLIVVASILAIGVAASFLLPKPETDVD